MVEQIQPQIQASPVTQQAVMVQPANVQDSQPVKKKKKWWIWLLIGLGVIILIWLGFSFFGII